MKRANDRCEVEGCGLGHKGFAYSIKIGNKREWFFDPFKALRKLFKNNKLSSIDQLSKNIKRVKVIITIAHLDHDEGNHDVKDDRLMAMCQLHHLRYDAKEKQKRKLNLKVK